MAIPLSVEPFTEPESDRQSASAWVDRLLAAAPVKVAIGAVLVRLYAAEKTAGETPTSFFRRLEVPRVKALLADLETMTPEPPVRPTTLISRRRRCFVPRRWTASARRSGRLAYLSPLWVSA